MDIVERNPQQNQQPQKQAYDQFILYREVNQGINQSCFEQIKSNKNVFQLQNSLEKKLWMIGERAPIQKQLDFFKNFMKRFYKNNEFKHVSQSLSKQDFLFCSSEQQLNNLSTYWKMIFSLQDVMTDHILNLFKSSFVFLDSETDFKYLKNGSSISSPINNFSVQTALSINCSLSYISKLQQRNNINVPKITYIRIEKSIDSNLNEYIYRILNNGIYYETYKETFQDYIQFLCLSDVDLESRYQNQKFYKLEKSHKQTNKNSFESIIDNLIQDVKHFQSQYVIITYPFDLEEGLDSNNQKPFFQNKLFKYLLVQLQKIINDKILLITTSDNYSMSNYKQISNYQQISIQKKLTQAIKILKNEYKDEIDLTNSFIVRPIQQDQHDSTDSRTCNITDKSILDDLNDDKQTKKLYNLNQWLTTPNTNHLNSNFLKQLQNDMNNKIIFGPTLNGNTLKLEQNQLHMEIQECQDIFIDKLAKLFPLHIQIQQKIQIVKEDKNEVIEAKVEDKQQQSLDNYQQEDLKSLNKTEENILEDVLDEQEQQQLQQKNKEQQQREQQQQQQQQLEISKQDEQNQIKQQQVEQQYNEVLQSEQQKQEKQIFFYKETHLLNIKKSSDNGKIMYFNSNLLLEKSGIIKFRIQIDDLQIPLIQKNIFSCVRLSGQQLEIYLSISQECQTANKEIDPNMIYYCKINQNLDIKETINFTQYKEVEYQQDELQQRSITCDDQFLYLLNGVQQQSNGTILEMKACKKIDLVNKNLIQMDQCEFLIQDEETAPIYLFNTQDNIFYGGIPIQGNGDDQYSNLLMQVYDKQQNRWFSHQTKIKENCNYIFCSGKERNSFYQLIFQSKSKQKKKQAQSLKYSASFYKLEDTQFKQTVLNEVALELSQKQFLVTSNNIPGKVMISSWEHQIELIDIDVEQ
ncbi:hypothetical protein ABPG72_014860 [Tetrahymena utriculariae]